MVPRTFKAAAAAIAVLSGGGALASAGDAEAQSRGYGGYNNEQRIYDAEMRVVNADYHRDLSRCSFFERGCQEDARATRAREAFEVNARYGLATRAELDQAYSLSINAAELQRRDGVAECWTRRNRASCQLSEERRALREFQRAGSWRDRQARRLGRN